MATRGGVSREGTAKATVCDQISQAVQSTSNLLHLMQLSSPSRALLLKLPKNLLEKASTIKNTGQVIEQMPCVISSLDAHMESGLQSVPHLKTVNQLLSNMDSCQLSSPSQSFQTPEVTSIPTFLTIAALSHFNKLNLSYKIIIQDHLPAE